MSRNEIAKLSTVINCDTKGIDRAFKLIKGGLQTADKDMNGFQRSVAKVGDALNGWKVMAIVGVTTALTAMAAKAVQVAGQFEQLNVSFEVLAGGKQTGDELVTSLTNLANVTPMTTQGLAENAKLLLSFGEATQNVIPDLKLLGDISGGNQEKMNSLALAFAQSGSAGRLMGQDLLQMVNAGFNPLQEMSKKTGKSMGELRQEMEKGLIPFSMVKQAFKDATSEGGRFYGMMDKQSRTLNGVLSTLADKWNLVAKNIGDAFLPVAKSAANVLIRMADATLRLQNELKRLEHPIDRARIGLEKLFGMHNSNNALVFTMNTKKTTNTPSKPSQEGFKDSSKTGSTKKGKSYDSVLNEHANLIKSQSDLDIAQNNYTDAQILQKKILLQQRLIALYRSTSIKGQTEQIQSQTELLNLERQYQDQALNDKIAALNQEASVAKAYNAMDTNEKLANLNLTEQEKAKIISDAQNAELQAEVRLQQAILELKRKGVTDLSQLSQKDREEYERQLLSKLQAEQNFQQQVVATAQAGRAAEVEAAKELSNTITDGFRGMVNGTYSVTQAFGNMLENIALKIASSGIENMLTKIFAGSGSGSGGVVGNFIGKATGSSALGSFFGMLTGHANGGNPSTQRPFIAGERGAELVVPSNKTKVFTNKETQGIFGGSSETQGQSIQPVIVSNTFKVETMNGDNAIKTLQQPSSKAAIQQMVAEGIRLNQNGLRSTVKGV